MPVILLIEKSGKRVKESNVKLDDLSELYKKAGFKNGSGMESPAAVWPRPGIDKFTLDYEVRLFGKTKGRAGFENKYEFPPPLDNVLFFGTVVLVAVDQEGKICDLKTSTWEMLYEQLFGGFEDLDNMSETRSVDELMPDQQYTKEGYLKDDFVVSDSEPIEYNNGFKEVNLKRKKQKKIRDLISDAQKNVDPKTEDEVTPPKKESAKPKKSSKKNKEQTIDGSEYNGFIQSAELEEEPY